MTDLLKDTLTERADAAVPAALALDTIITTGNRRIRRRRVLAVAGTALVTLAVLATGLTLARGVDREPAPAVASFAERRATYATGSEIHYGADVISAAPQKISAFVQTDTGFVFIPTGAEGGLFLADGKQIHKLADYPGDLTDLTAARDGNLVGWIEPSEGRYDSVIYDVAARREVVRTPLGNTPPPIASLVDGPRIVAIDGGYAYLGTLDGVYRWDLRTGQYRLIVPSVRPSAIRTLAADRYLFDTDPRLLRGPQPITLQLRTLAGSNVLSSYSGKYGYLSPTGKHLLTAAADPQKITPPPADLKLFETTTHQQLPFTHPDHPRLIFNQWLTDTTFTAAGLRTTTATSPVDLLTCSTTSLTCETTTTDISAFNFTKSAPRVAPFVLPIGSPIRWLFG
ncbi:hypothetical protein AB0P21_00370 [Kribbella sp. NPDC056861]|uniref:hypothetical protein n=1 Tax=Kribbella sp. NPDC056861 TaxID=3154857 RepID=UPI00343B2EF8